jgi:hypothetical protein
MTHHNEKQSQLKALLASYGRSVLGAAVALYASGVTDPQTLAYALLGAIVPVAIRAINPNDKAFGILPDAAEVEKALKSAKAPAKKAAPKKAAKKAAK